MMRRIPDRSKRILSFFILAMLFSAISVFAQKKQNYLLSYIETISGTEMVGFKNRAGEIIIKAKYQAIGYDADQPEKMHETACVFGDSGWVFINKKDSVVLKPYIYDNGPDYIEEGLFRFVEHDSIGFANKYLKKIIRARYSFATPFKDGISEFYIGGERIFEGRKTAAQIYQEGGDLIDRHWVWGGTTVTDVGYVNKSGQEFKEVNELKNNTREAWTKNNKHVLLNKQGRIIKIYKNVHLESLHHP